MDTNEVPTLAEELSGAQLGDRRLTRRLGKVAEQLSTRPEVGFPKAMVDEGSLAGLYRLVGNERLQPEAIVAPHVHRTVERAQGMARIVVSHDTTTFSFAGEAERDGLGRLTGTEQGFLSHMSLAIGQADGRPLGVLGVDSWTRSRQGSRRGKPQRRPVLVDSENARWVQAAKKAQQSLEGCEQAVHVMDRDADGYSLYAELQAEAIAFVVRACHERRASAEGSTEVEPLGEVVGKCGQVRLERVVELSRRRGKPDKKARAIHPPRQGRQARLSCSACRVVLHRPARCLAAVPKELELNVVEVREAQPLAEQPPVHWRLVTNEPVDTAEQVAQVVDAYRSRWLIEEYFKALKTGCAFEQRQLESYGNLQRALSVFVPIAWRLLLLRHMARALPEALASEVLSASKLHVLRALSYKLRRKTLAEQLTVSEALYAVAALGGHLKRNGAPGWRTLGAGWQRVLEAEMAWEAFNELTSA
jgi:hypothetical protein